MRAGVGRKFCSRRAAGGRLDAAAGAIPSGGKSQGRAFGYRYTFCVERRRLAFCRRGLSARKGNANCLGSRRVTELGNAIERLELMSCRKISRRASPRKIVGHSKKIPGGAGRLIFRKQMCFCRSI